MNCPYCLKKDFIPSVAERHAEGYGGGTCHVRCNYCKKIVQIYLEVVIKCTYVDKSTQDYPDWET